MKPLRAKCAHCHEEIVVSRLFEYKACKCGKIYLDYGDGYHYSMGGYPEDFDKEYDRKHGIDRFTGFAVPSSKEKDADTVIVSSTPETSFGAKVLPMNVLVESVWDWFDEKGLSDPVIQMVKVQEEIGELAWRFFGYHNRNVPPSEYSARRGAVASLQRNQESKR